MNSKETNILLFIIISIIFIGIGFYILKPKNNSSTIEENIEQKTKSTSIEESKEIEPSKIEKETKISISQARFDEITKFIFSQNDISLPINLSEKEKIEIEKNRKFFKRIFENQKKINNYQKEIDDYNNKLKEIENKKIELNKKQKTTNIEIEIADLEADKKMYTNMLKNVEKVKKPLDEDFEPSKNNRKKIVIDELNKIYQITN